MGFTIHPCKTTFIPPCLCYPILFPVDSCWQVEKIAKERGEISTGLHALLKEKEAKIKELSQRVHEYDQFMENTEGEFKTKLDKKSKVTIHTDATYNNDWDFRQYSIGSLVTELLGRDKKSSMRIKLREIFMFKLKSLRTVAHYFFSISEVHDVCKWQLYASTLLIQMLFLARDFSMLTYLYKNWIFLARH